MEPLKKITQESLEEQLSVCSYVTGKARKFFEQFLLGKGIYDLTDVTVDLIRTWQIYVRSAEDLSPSQKSKYISIPEQIMYEYYRDAYPQLIQKAEDLIKQRPVRRRVCTFLMLEGVHSAEQIDCRIREEYAQFLHHTVSTDFDEYMKALDILKLDWIKGINDLKRQQILLNLQKHPDRKVFLLYFPDYEIAKSFYYIQNKDELVFDFSRDVSEQLKTQVCRMLLHVLADHPYKNNRDRHDRRERFLIPLQLLYNYCVDAGISDIQRMEKEDINGFRESMDGHVGSKTEIYMQIVDNVRKYLFMSSSEVAWRANVWYLERFQIEEHRLNGANPVQRLNFLSVRNLENRQALQNYLQYLLAVSTRNAVQTIRCRFYACREFLQFLEAHQVSLQGLSEGPVSQYVTYLEEKHLEPETFNTEVGFVLRFLGYLHSKKVISGNMDIFYSKKFYKKHHDRTVPEPIQKKVIRASNRFPVEVRLIYLTLLGTGLRLNEVCQLRRSALRQEEHRDWLYVYQPKMKTFKKIPIPGILFQYLEGYCTKMERDADAYIFQGCDGGPYRAGTFRKKMRRELEKNDISPREYIFSAHDYRHTIATELFDDGAGLQVIREFLGHTSTDMTKQYIDYMDSRIDALTDEFYSNHDHRKKRYQDGKN